MICSNLYRILVLTAAIGACTPAPDSKETATSTTVENSASTVVSSVEGASASIPTGIAPANANITLSAGQTLQVGSLAVALGIDGSDDSAAFVAASTPLTFSTDVPFDAPETTPFVLSVTISDAALRLIGNDTTRLAIFYRVTVASQGGAELVGVIPRHEISLEGNKLTFKSRYFGTYQAFYTPQVVTAAKTVDASTVTNTERTQSTAQTSASASPQPTAPPVVDASAPVAGNSGSLIISRAKTTISVSWTAASDDVTTTASMLYKVYYSTSNNITTLTNITTNGTQSGGSLIGSTTATISGLIPGTMYYINVIATDGAGRSVAYTSKQAKTTVATGVCYDNFVTAVATEGTSSIFVGGPFKLAGACTGSGAFLSASNLDDAVPAGGLDAVDGTIHAATSDGNGGYYIGGSITRVGAATRHGLAHVFADGSVDPNFHPNIAYSSGDGTIKSLLRVGSTLYIGGQFDTVDGVTRSNAAAIDITATPSVLSWNPNADLDVTAIATDGTSIFIAGSFTMINSPAQARAGVAKVHATSGADSGWDAGLDLSPVDALLVDSGKVYIAGSFFTPYQGFAVVSATNGVAEAWDPQLSGNIYAFAKAGSTLYVAGDFSSVAGTSRTNLAAINMSLAPPAVLPLNIATDMPINELTIAGSNLLLGGMFTSVGGQAHRNLAAINVTNGTLVANVAQPNAAVNSLATSTDGTMVYVGGQFSSLRAEERMGLAKLDANGDLSSWKTASNLTAAANVNALAVTGGKVYVGGAFSTPRNRLAAFDTNSGALDSWNPVLTGNEVFALTTDGTWLYAGGNISQANGTATGNIVGYQLTNSMTQKTFATGAAGGDVKALALAGTTLYAAGNFSTLMGSSCQYLGGINTSNSTSIAWNPIPNYRPDHLLFDGAGYLYVGGSFTDFNGVSTHQYAARFTTANNSIDSSWNPQVDAYVGSFALAENGHVYLAGGMTMSGATSVDQIIELDQNGALQTWQPPHIVGSPSVLAVVNPTTLFLGGNGFDRVGGALRKNGTLIDRVTGAVR